MQGHAACQNWTALLNKVTLPIPILFVIWRRAEKQRLAKLYEAFRRISAGGSSLDQLANVILKAIRNLINSEHNLLMFVDNARNQLWTKWTLGTVMDNKVCY